MAGPIAAPATLAPASIGAPRRVIGRGRGKVALPPSSAIGFGLKTSPFARATPSGFEGAYCAKRSENFAMRNETKWQALEIIGREIA
jgi:hypothetical protein